MNLVHGQPLRFTCADVGEDVAVDVDVNDYVQRMLTEFLRWRRLPARGLPLEAAFDALAEVYADCRVPDWDGYGARPISSRAVEVAFSILLELPGWLPLPEVVPEPDGEIGLEWDRGWATFVVSVSGNRLLTYAGVFGQLDKTHGTEPLAGGKVPGTVMHHLSRLFSWGGQD